MVMISVMVVPPDPSLMRHIQCQKRCRISESERNIKKKTGNVTTERKKVEGEKEKKKSNVGSPVTGA
jgi:hypothetical protein